MLAKHLHLEVLVKQCRFMLKLLAALPFVRVSPPDTAAEQRIYDNVAQGFRELQQLCEGKLQARPIEELLNELAD